ncbi:hypothetical protein SUDANB37_02503 [Streptomyces sp. enrichment culture]
MNPEQGGTGGVRGVYVKGVHVRGGAALTHGYALSGTAK